MKQLNGKTFLTKAEVAAIRAAKAKHDKSINSNLAKAREAKEIEDNGGMRISYVNKGCPTNNPTPSLYTVGGHKIRHRKSGVDQFQQQKYYAEDKVPRRGRKSTN